MTNKERIVRMVRLFQTQTDEEHPISTFEIIEYFKGLGTVIDRNTIRDDVDTLNACGIEVIILEGRPNRYYFTDSRFQLPELKLLVDAVEGSKFITAKKSRELVGKIISMASTGYADELNRHLYTVGRIKPENENIYYVIDAIFRAIQAEQKISFQYFRFDANRERVPRHDGEPFVLSPYAMLYNEDKYYVLGYYGLFGKITTFRVDRMGIPEILAEPAHPKPEGFDPVDYTVDVFSMYEGSLETVELLCENIMMDPIVDRFGEEADTQIAGSGHFLVRAQVSVSRTFFAWVFQFAGKIQILEPASVKVQYQEMLGKALVPDAGQATRRAESCDFSYI